MNYLQLPVEVLPHLRRLSAVQLAIWADAWTWQLNGKQSRRSNAQFGEMLGISSRAASEAIAALVKFGLLSWAMDSGGRVLTATPPDNFHPPVKVPPSGSTSIRSNFHPPSGSTSTPPPGEVPPPLRSNFHQIEKGIENRIEKGIENKVREQKSTRRKPKEREYHDVVMPFDSETFSAAWREWLDYKWAQHRFAYKRKQDEQTALHHLQKNSNGNEQLAIHIIAASIANGWQGLFASSAKKSNMGAGSRSGGYFHSSGKYEHPADVLKDRDIWG